MIQLEQTITFTAFTTNNLNYHYHCVNNIDHKKKMRKLNEEKENHQLKAVVFFEAVKRKNL